MKRRTRKPFEISSFGSKTDIGCIRDHNEDSLLVAPPLFAVCDGMGGHEAGEIASEIAVATLERLAPKHPLSQALGRAVEVANQEIINAANCGMGRPGMGTTCTAAIVEGEKLVVAQVGDSRAYLLTNGKLQQLTRDHSLVADMLEAGQITEDEARTSPNRSIITRALGTAENTRPDLYEVNVCAGDRLLLCSDGLPGMLKDAHIQNILNGTPDPQHCASKLVNEAISAGGYDNITVIVVDIEGCQELRQKKFAKKTKMMALSVLLVLAALIGGAAAGLNYWISNAAFLGVENQMVAVYSGVPGTFLGMNFNHLDHVSSLPLSELNPGVADRIRKNTITTSSIQDADNLIELYKREIYSAEVNNSNNPQNTEKNSEKTTNTNSTTTNNNQNTNATNTENTTPTNSANTNTQQNADNTTQGVTQ